jgi:low affinity Fe/Cu permease
MNELFRTFAQKISGAAGSSWAFLLAFAVVIIWAVSGPIFHYSETWQLVINTGTTIVTFLMVFLVQNAQNRGEKAMQLKLDELIRVQKMAHNKLIQVEKEPEKKIEKAEKQIKKEITKTGERIEKKTTSKKHSKS